MASRTALLIPGLALALASSLMVSRAAHADVPRPPDPCDGKAKGDPCDGGVRVTEKCSKLDYSKGVPPSSVEYDCVKCGAKPADAPAPAAGEPAATPAPTPKASGCSVAGDNSGLSLALLLLLGAGYRRSRRAAA